MATLTEIVKREVAEYGGSGRGINIRTISLLDDVNQSYGINTIGYPEKTRPAGVMVLARVEGEMVIIEEDRTDKPLVEALIQAGIPREKIILAYAGEPIPESAK